MWNTFLPLASVRLGSANLLNTWLNNLQVSILKPWTPTRPDGMYILSCPPFARLRRIISLQLSTSLAMPFNPYRQNRVPDHLNRSRYPVTMPQQHPNRAGPMRATSFDGWHNQHPIRTPYQPNYPAPMYSQVNFNQYNSQVSSSIMQTPKSTDPGMSYFVASQTPEPQESWDDGKNSSLNENPIFLISTF